MIKPMTMFYTVIAHTLYRLVVRIYLYNNKSIVGWVYSEIEVRGRRPSLFASSHG